MTAFCENGQLHVVLSEVETVKYNIDIILFNRETSGADKVLVDLLKLAVSKTGFKTRATKFLIEIYPVMDGGCEIYFIPDEQERSEKVHVVAKKAASKFMIFEFNDSEKMFSAIELLFKNPLTRYAKSSLFEYKLKYRLILYSANSKQCEAVSVCGFVDKILTSLYDRAITAEYAKELCSDFAVFTVGKALCSEIKDF